MLYCPHMTSPPTQSRTDAQLSRLAEVALQVSEAMAECCLPTADRPANPSVVPAFERAARILRLTLILQDKLSRPDKSPTIPRTTTERRLARTRRDRDYIHRAVEREIGDRADADPIETEELYLELEDRLADEDIAVMMEKFSREDMILRICYDIGVEFDVGKLSDAMIASIIAESKEVRPGVPPLDPAGGSAPRPAFMGAETPTLASGPDPP
jgi:hypothetical protein